MSHVEKNDMPIVVSLKKIGKILPRSMFLISGHTDMVGSYEMNVELSKGRAEILKQLLVEFGVSANRVQTKWFSFDAPIDTNDSAEGREKNRRVVATVYGLSAEEAASLANAVKKSNRFYVIKIENEMVENYVTDVLVPQIETPVVVEEPPVDREKELALQRQKELDLQNQKLEDDRLKALRRQKLKESQRYYVGYEISDNQLNAKSTGFEATWVTDFNQALNFAYQYKFWPKLWVGVEAGYKLRKFRIDDNQIYNWDGDSPNLLNFALRTDYTLNEKLNLGVDVKYFEDNFVIYNGLDIDLEKASLLSLGLRAEYKLKTTKLYDLRLKLMIENPVLGFGDLDPSGSLSYYGGADVSLISIHKNYDLNFSLIYGLRNFENIQNEQSENYLGFEIKLRNKNW